MGYAANCGVYGQYTRIAGKNSPPWWEPTLNWTGSGLRNLDPEVYYVLLVCFCFQISDSGGGIITSVTSVYSENADLQKSGQKSKNLVEFQHETKPQGRDQ